MPDHDIDAARAQGLEPLLAALDTDPRIDLVWLENTGGYCMAVVVPVNGGVVACTQDGGQWYACAYEGTAWDDGGDGDGHTLDTVNEVVDYIATLIETRQEG